MRETYFHFIVSLLFYFIMSLGDVWINLVGIAIGNGLTNPQIQYGYYAEVGYLFFVGGALLFYGDSHFDLLLFSLDPLFLHMFYFHALHSSPL